MVPIPVGMVCGEEAGQNLLPGHMELILAANKFARRLLVWDAAGMNYPCFFFAQPRALHGGLAGVNARRRRIARR